MVSSNGVINNKVGSSISGVTNTFTVTNPSNTASSAARETIIVGGGSAGDPTLNFNVSGVTNWEMGIDNSVSDNLTISQGTALGTNDVWRMNTAGTRTLPLQPAFLAVYSASVNNVTGDGTTYTAIYDTKVYDRGSNYNNANGIFTAPVAAVYIFTAVLNLSNLNAAHASENLDIVWNTTSIHGWTGNPFAISSAGNASVIATVILSLAASDTVKVTVNVTGGTKTVGVIAASYPTFYQNTFSGALLF